MPMSLQLISCPPTSRRRLLAVVSGTKSHEVRWLGPCYNQPLRVPVLVSHQDGSRSGICVPATQVHEASYTVHEECQWTEACWNRMQCQYLQLPLVRAVTCAGRTHPRSQATTCETMSTPSDDRRTEHSAPSKSPGPRGGKPGDRDEAKRQDTKPRDTTKRMKPRDNRKRTKPRDNMMPSDERREAGGMSS